MFKTIFHRQISNKGFSKLYYDIPKLIECNSNYFIKNQNICSDFTLDIIENKYLLCGFVDGNILIYDLEDHMNYGSAKVFDLHDDHKIKRSKKSINCLQWYPVDSGLFFTCGIDKKIDVWDANRGKCVESISLLYNTNWISLSPCSKSVNLIAVACDRNKSVLIDVISGSSTHVLSNNSADNMRTVQWSNREEYLLATGDEGGHVSLWDVRSSKKAIFHLDQFQNHVNDKNCQAHGGDVRGLEFSPDGLLLATLGNDGRLNVWNVISQTAKLLDLNFGKIFESDSITRHVRFCWTGYSNFKKLWVPSHLDINRLDLDDGSKNKFQSHHFDQIVSCIWNRALCELYTVSLDTNILNWKLVL